MLKIIQKGKKVIAKAFAVCYYDFAWKNYSLNLGFANSYLTQKYNTSPRTPWQAFFSFTNNFSTYY